MELGFSEFRMELGLKEWSQVLWNGANFLKNGARFFVTKWSQLIRTEWSQVSQSGTRFFRNGARIYRMELGLKKWCQVLRNRASFLRNGDGFYRIDLAFTEWSQVLRSGARFNGVELAFFFEWSCTVGRHGAFGENKVVQEPL